MALTICKECNREYSDTLNACPHCGYREQNTITIYGYTEPFAMNPRVEIYANEENVASVGKGERIELNIAQPCTLKFKMSIRNTTCNVKPGDIVVLSSNRTTGQLQATVTNEFNAHNVLSDKKRNDTLRIVLTIIICIIILIASLSLSI